jgi:hypothetical protein
MEYATHRLLWSWYSRDRDAQSPSSGWHDAPDLEPEADDDDGDSDDDSETA